jgi:hypothetical protein
MRPLCQPRQAEFWVKTMQTFGWSGILPYGRQGGSPDSSHMSKRQAGGDGLVGGTSGGTGHAGDVNASGPLAFARTPRLHSIGDAGGMNRARFLPGGRIGSRPNRCPSRADRRSGIWRQSHVQVTCGRDCDWESSLLGVQTKLCRGMSNALRLCRDQHCRKGDDPCRIAAACPSPQMSTPG